MDPAATLLAHFDEAAAALDRARHLMPGILQSAQAMAQALRNDHAILICGNGGSAADAQHFAAELTGRFEGERRGLRAIPLHVDTSALTAIANDYGFEHVFRRQVEALGRAGDVLVAISTSGISPNVLKAVEEAELRGMTTIGLLGRNGGKLSER
ncbi:MAG TPA: SIS domain-containing protein, partial [bacterium]|nr:SIS domain-containing protein [bacterium]